MVGGPRSSLPTNLRRAPASGGIQKRRSTGRIDREGDLDMSGQVPAGPRARPVNAGHVRPSRGTGPNQKSEAGPAKGLRPTRTLVRPATRSAKPPLGGFIELKVTGWKRLSNSTEATLFLEKKTKEKFRRVQTVGEAILFQVPLVKVAAIMEWDNVAFAGGNLKIQSLTELPASIQAAVKSNADRSEEAQQISVVLKNVLVSRYNAELKMLNLSNLPGDPELIKLGFFNQQSTTAKMFPAMMKVADEQFTSKAEKREQVVSVDLSSNGLADLQYVASLAITFPELKNLSLASNAIESWKQLDVWKYKFRKLDQLILSGNPIAQLPNYREDARKWWKTLTMLDAEPYPEPPPSKVSKDGHPGPFPQMALQIQPSGIVDDEHHTNTFLSTFFPSFDTDRRLCLQNFYNENSTFSLSVNVSAPRLTGDSKHAIQKWDHYIPRSRNMTRLRGASGVKDRLAKGPNAISKVWESIPRTLHPTTDPTKWVYDSRVMPYGDIMALHMTIHGEYEEPENIAKEGVASKRSFSRVFIVLPKTNGEAGYIIAKDMLMVRAFGGNAGWSPEVLAPALAQPATAVPAIAGQLPPQQQALIEQVMQRTGLTAQYATLCLEQTGWDLEKAIIAFNEVRASGNLPADALTVQAVA